jgi:hydroxypyruvate reductase
MGLLPSHPQDMLVTDVLTAALASVAPHKAVVNLLQKTENILRVGRRAYDLADYGSIYLIGFGKAVMAMAAGALDAIGDDVTGGYLIAKHLEESEAVSLPASITISKGNHPVPGDDTFSSSQALIAYCKQVQHDDLAIVLISGGGSALCSAPVEGVTAEDMQALTRELLACGAEIQEMNAIRKHVDRIKGGGLAQLLVPATVITLILSDVIGSPLDVIASGPTVPDQASFTDVAGIFDQYQIWETIPQPISSLVNDGLQRLVADTPKEGEACFTGVQNVLIADNAIACRAAQEACQAGGVNAQVMTTYLSGEAREVGKVLSSFAHQIRHTGEPFAPPCCLIFGGETTVTLKGSGKGGRNQEVVLGAVRSLAGLADVLLITLATDGEDGPTDAAGAWATGETYAKARKLGLSVDQALADNDAYHFFEGLNQIVHTGPSGTNVNDLSFLFVF